jgi:m7GpppX diphosphatase
MSNSKLYKTDSEMSYSFVIGSDWLDKVNKGNLVFENDSFQKFDANLNIDGELVICNDIKKLNFSQKKLIEESYEDYLKFINNYNFAKDKWIYNILDGTAEYDKVLYLDTDILIIPSYLWNGTDISKMHILTMPFDKTLHSIRDLNETHIPLLEKIRDQTINLIKSKYGIDRDKLKMFLHYAPSTYHLHVHFGLISNTEMGSSVEYSHELNSVINILKLIPNYYQLITMQKRV